MADLFLTTIFANLRCVSPKDETPVDIVQPYYLTLMKKNIIVTCVLATLSLLLAAPATAQTSTDTYIDINTTVEREVTPNELYLQISIREKDYKGKKSLEQMQDAMLGALKANHIDIPECLTLNYMGSEVGYKAFSKSIKSQTEATYMLKLNDAAIMQSVIASLEEKQISDIELVRTRYTAEKELKAEMGIEAMQTAKAEAQMLAGAIGQETGKAMTISYWMNNTQAQPRLYKARMSNVSEEADAVGQPAGEPMISIGKITYRFTVNVRFELK